jgi:hypothetical protein
MEALLLVTASVAVLTGLVGFAYGLMPQRPRPQTMTLTCVEEEES